jgi:hypothetical protein
MYHVTKILPQTCGRVALIGDLTSPLSSSTYHFNFSKKSNTRVNSENYYFHIEIFEGLFSYKKSVLIKTAFNN